MLQLLALKHFDNYFMQGSTRPIDYILAGVERFQAQTLAGPKTFDLRLPPK